MDVSEFILREGGAALIGVGLGLNRYLHHKSIGVRTLGLVAIASAALVATSGDALNADGASRVIQGLVTGIGFIGAGLILRDPSGTSVHGLTTAATVWAAVAIGVLCGLGDWRFVVVTAAFAGALLTLGGKLEKAVARHFGSRQEGPGSERGD